MAKRTKTSKAWMHEHVTDPFVKAAKREGYRSRAAFKLLEIDKRDSLFKPGATVVDLGAAPGGWSQVARERLGRTGRVVAVDLLPMEPIDGVDFLQVDFTDDAGMQSCLALLGPKPVDIVISDMAPNISGIGLSDQARAMELAELALDFAVEHLEPGGMFLVKLFQGEGFEDYVKALRARFKQVVTRKPEASRDRSNEVYLLGKTLKNQLQ
jgi:23S rRNA (uridine2552-2'-O)-methyltransferase